MPGLVPGYAAGHRSDVGTACFLAGTAAVGSSGAAAASRSCGAAAYAAIALPLPLAAIATAIAVAGFALGIAITVSIASVLALAGADARGTANSLRMMGNRVGQFTIPFLAGLIAAATGAAGIFLVIGASLAASATTAQFGRRGSSGR